MQKIIPAVWWLVLILVMAVTAQAQEEKDTSNAERPIVYTFRIDKQIGPAVWRTTQKSINEAERLNAKYIIIEMNTYGGMVESADSIRTKILNTDIPTYVFIDNNAASAGALIAISCDSIYMRPGGSIGAATVVNQSGEKMPDKYQSYMRSTMRATAEAHGKDTIIRGNDTIIEWHRDPRIAEAMVDESVSIPGIIDSTKVLTFTTNEAIENGFSEGKADNIEQVIEKTGIEDYELVRFISTGMDKVIGFLISPVLQGILIMIIIGGIYFELQSPGIGFPLAASVIAAMLYFAPLYLEGLAENWELLLFIGGLVLIGIEIFALPGFGIAGISGVVLVLTGLTLSMVDKIVWDLEYGNVEVLLRALLIVVLSVFFALILSIYLSKKLFTSSIFSGLALEDVQDVKEGYTSFDSSYHSLKGKTGVALTVLRPSGKVELEGEIYDAVAETGFIGKDEQVKVIRYETGQLHVLKLP